MELEKAETNSELDLNSRSIEILQECHEKILAVKLPKKPNNLLPESLVLGWVNSDAKEFFASLTTFAMSCLATGYAVTLINGPVGTALGIGAGVIALSAITNAGSSVNDISLACRLQRLWRKKGLPARKLQALEKKQAEAMEPYLRQAVICQKKIAKINKRVQPELKRVNAQSKEFTFTFGIEGLVTHRRQNTAAHPSFVYLAKELGA